MVRINSRRSAGFNRAASVRMVVSVVSSSMGGLHPAVAITGFQWW
jgi:hypothetical protein